MTFTLYTDPTVSFIMRGLGASLAEFNHKAEAALAQSTQSLPVPSEITGSGQAGGVLLPQAPTPPAAIQVKP